MSQTFGDNLKKINFKQRIKLQNLLNHRRHCVYRCPSPSPPTPRPKSQHSANSEEFNWTKVIFPPPLVLIINLVQFPSLEIMNFSGCVQKEGVK